MWVISTDVRFSRKFNWKCNYLIDWFIHLFPKRKLIRRLSNLNWFFFFFFKKDHQHLFYCSVQWFCWRWSICTVRSPEGVRVMWQWESESSVGCVIGEAPLMIVSQRRKRAGEIHYLIAQEKEMRSYSPDSYSQLREAFTLNVNPKCLCVREREREREEGEGSVQS